MAAMVKYENKKKRQKQKGERSKQAQLPAAERLMKEVGSKPMRFGHNRPRQVKTTLSGA
jgi:hypothetical protein